MGRAEEIQPPPGEVRWESQLPGLGQPVQGNAALGLWSEDEMASLLFLSLTGGAGMYFIGLPDREKMAYGARVEALRGRFGQETNTSITLQELAGLRRGIPPGRWTMVSRY